MMMNKLINIYKLIILFSVVVIVSCYSHYAKVPRFERNVEIQEIYGDSASSLVIEFKINLLVRDFINNYNLNDADYGYYSYLILNDRSQSTYSKRFAAASQFLCQFHSVEDVILQGYIKKQLAVFYSPVKNDVNRENIRKPENLLDSYDYAFASILVNRLNLTDFDLGIIISPIAIHNINDPVFESMDSELITKINLSNKNEREIAKIIKKYRNSFNMGKDIDDIEIQTIEYVVDGELLKKTAFIIKNHERLDKMIFAERFRDFLNSIGTLVNLTLSTEEVVATEKDPQFFCK